MEYILSSDQHKFKNNVLDTLFKNQYVFKINTYH